MLNILVIIINSTIYHKNNYNKILVAPKDSLYSAKNETKLKNSLSHKSFILNNMNKKS